ncbi:MAG TPA: formylmethanofuran dehydrogenase [Ideonella sp.]|nr:formylmethanofuran dehydrogenase [Ideonella sp.]
MTDTDAAPAAGAPPWTCPFCPLLCDSFGVDADPGLPTLVPRGTDCAKARAGLARFSARPPAAPAAFVHGQASSVDAAITAAAERLAAARQPLFGGLGTDVAGARALYALACQTGAVCDAAQGAAMMHGLRALQDRGRFSTTLAEVHERADLVVCVGGDPSERYPLFFERCGLAAGDARLATLQPGPGQDLFDTVALLAAAVDGRRLSAPLPEALAGLAARLAASRYAVIVYETGRLPAQGALIVEALNRIVGTLNRTTRAAALALGGGDGASTVNEVFTWLSGLPLRSRAGPAGLEHEPLCFDAQRLLAGGAVDALLWVASFGAQPVPATAGLPRIVLGPAAMAGEAAADVFIAVATPGIGAGGHLFRVDGSVVVPLRPVIADGLPTVAEVLRQLSLALRSQRQGVAA